MRSARAQKVLAALFAVLVVSAVGYAGYRGYALVGENIELTRSLEDLQAKFAALSHDFEVIGEATAALRAELERVQAERAEFERKYLEELAKVRAVEDKIEDISSTVGRLTKIAAVDPELLKKYSKVYFLNENYLPSSLSQIPPSYTMHVDRALYFHTKALRFLDDLMDEAEDDGIGLKIISAFRSFGEQSGLKATYKITYGTGANRFSADQGYSEHQLGTAIDFTTPELGEEFTAFAKTAAYGWLTDNAYRFGFVLSYPANNPYYVFEPWHWRFVGRELANRLREENKYFYELDQREIDRYLESFFD
jgi:LAS superfamily LD-carboxypeptidase LdcB